MLFNGFKIICKKVEDKSGRWISRVEIGSTIIYSKIYDPNINLEEIFNDINLNCKLYGQGI